MQCISSTTVGKKIRRQIFYSPCRRWDIRSPPVCMSFPITFLTASSPTSGTSCRRRLMMQSLPLTFSRLFPIWRNPFTYHISAGFLTVLTIRFILTVSATPVTIFFCLTGICASQPSGAVPGTHSIFRLPSTQHGLRNSLAFHPKAVCFVPILTCTIFHLSALSMKVPITVPSATRRTICAAIWQASLLPRRKCGESTSSRRFLLPDGSRNSPLSCPIPKRNMKC